MTDSLFHQDNAVRHHGARLVAEGVESFRVRVLRSCGHEYRSETHWNSPRAAINHGRDLVDLCVCGHCRRRHTAPMELAA